MADAKFEDGAERPVNLVARDADDLAVVSALVQDAVLTVADMRYLAAQRRFTLLVNRFRWEDGAVHDPERVRALLVIDDVRLVRVNGFDRSDPDLVLSILTTAFSPGEDGTGTLTLTFAGDGALALELEALEITLKDVTRPYRAVSGKAPKHPA